MTQCTHCNKKINGIPYTCKRCQDSFCGDHRLPESHNCSGLKRNYPKNITAEEVIYDLTSGNKEKRKNAAIQLENLSWVPQTEVQKAYFLFAYQRGDDLLKLGDAALEPLLPGLMDKDITIQEFSARLLGMLGNPVAIESLLQKLYNPHTPVRIAVALALNNLGWLPRTDNERIGLIIAQQRWSDLDQFGKKIIEPLSVILDNENEDIKFQVISTLCKIDDERIIDILSKAVQDRSKKVRITAVQGLVNLKNPDTVDTLIIALNDVDSAIQRTARNGLIQLDSDAVEKLIDTLKRNETDYPNISQNVEDIILKTDIIFILGEIQDSRALDYLKHISIEGKSEPLKKSANEAIGKIELQLNTLQQKSNVYCIKCFSNFTKNKMSFLSFMNSSSISVCRKCNNNKNYLEDVKKVVLLLDDMNELYNFKNNVLCVNWFKIKRPIDMHEIEIIKGTNEDIAELVMKLKNDDDSERKKTYKHTQILIAKDLNISQAKINLLQNTFGNVHVVEKDTINRLGE